VHNHPQTNRAKTDKFQRGLFTLFCSILLFLTIFLPSFVHADALGEHILAAILRNEKPADGTLLLMTRDLKWYEQIMGSLPPNIQVRVQQLRINAGGEAARMSAIKMNEAASVFAATGSWKPGRDMDIIYFGKNGDHAANTISESYEAVTGRIITNAADDPILRSFQQGGGTIPRALSAECLAVCTTELPNYGYSDLHKAYKKAQEALARGESKDDILKALRNDIREVMGSNIKAHFAAASNPDYYAGATGQEWFKKTYLNDTERMRVFAQDANGNWSLRPGGIDAVPKEIAEQLGFGSFGTSQMKFSKIASDYSLFFSHMHGGPSDNAKYAMRVWSDMGLNAIQNLTDDELRILTTAKIISKNPNRAAQILTDMGIGSVDDFNQGIACILHGWTESQLVLNMESIMAKLAGSSVKATDDFDELHKLLRQSKATMELNEIVAGLNKLSAVPNGKALQAQLLERLQAKFGNTDIGKAAIKLILKNLGLLGDTGDLTARIMVMLLRAGKITDAELDAFRAGRPLSGRAQAQVNQVKKELIALNAGAMVEFDDALDLEKLMNDWRTSQPGAILQNADDDIKKIISELHDAPDSQLRNLGWTAEEIATQNRIRNYLRSNKQVMPSLGARLEQRLAKAGIRLSDVQHDVRMLMFNPAYTKLGDPSMSVGAFDAVIGSAAALYQTYAILYGPSMKEEDENIALSNAWVTAIPIVGDFAQAIITGSEAYWEGDKKKMLDAGLWMAVGVTGLIPGGQLPAVIGSMMLALKPVAEGIYDARQAQNLVQAWIESGKWSTGKPPQLEGIYDRNGLLHRLTYDEILGTKGEIKYDSTRIKSIPFGEFTIAQSVRDYANRYVLAGNKNVDVLRENIKTIFPDLTDNILNDLAYADRKVNEKNSKLARMFFKAYERQVKSGYIQTIAHLKKWAEDERRVAKDYDGEVKRLRAELASLEKELKNASLVKHADDTVNSYTKMATNLFEQESLPLSRVRIYENYIATYKQIKNKLQGVAKLFAEASSKYVPSSWFLTGYPTFDRDITDRLVTLMTAERARSADQVVQLLKDMNQKDTYLNLQNECHKKAFDIIAPKRYKIAFAQHLSEYFRALAGESSKWSDAYESAKASYEGTRDSILKTLNPPAAAIDNAYLNAFTTFFFAMGFAIASNDADQYRQVADGYEAQMVALREQDKSDRMAGTESEAGKALQLCLKIGLEIEIQLSTAEPEAGADVEAAVKLKKGTLPKETSWAWETKGGLTVKPRFGEKTVVKANSEGELTLRLMDERYTNKSIAETKVKIVPKVPRLNLTLIGPQEGEIGKSLAFAVDPSSDIPLPKDIQYEWKIDGQTAGQGRQIGRSFTQAKSVGVSVDAYRMVDGKKIVLGSAQKTVAISNPKSKKDEAAEKQKEKEKLEQEKAEKEQEERKKAEKEKLEREKKLKEPPVCKYQYSEWGECSRENKKQTRSVIGTEPDNCVEKDRPALEQACTPPPTTEERKTNFLSCLCFGCQTGLPSMSGHFASEGACKGMCDCPAPLGGSCRPVIMDNEKIKRCYGSAYDIKEPDENDTRKAREIVVQTNRKMIKPMKITLSPDAKPIKAKYGSVVNLSASVEGGMAGYTYSWSGQGSPKDNTFSFINTRQTGTYSVSVTVNDSDGGSATASTTILVEDIKVTITGLKGTVYYGSSLALTAEVTGSATPIKQQSQPIATETKVSPTSSKSEGEECTPGATCIWACHTRFCKCICPPQPYKVQYMCSPEEVSRGRLLCKDHGKPCGTCPSKKVPEPVKDAPKEEIKSGETGSITVLWQSSPNLPFSPQQGSSTKVTFDRMGKIKIWAVVQRETGKGVYETVGESEQQEVTVIAPKFTVSFKPEKSGVGQEVRATITPNPSIPDKMVNYVWISPTSRMPYEKNESVIGFTPRDTKTVELTASARVPTIGETISDDIKAVFTAQQYTVKATVLGIPETRRPRIWKPGVGLVTLDSSAYGADEHVKLKVDIEGYPNPSEVRWNWTANEGTSLTSPTSREPAAYRHETGTATLTVTAKDKENIELGRATASFPVTVSQEMIKDSAKKAEAADKLSKAKALVPQGKLDEGIILADEAAKLDPKNTEAPSLTTKWKSERDQVKTRIETTKKFIKESKLTEAEKELSEAQKLHPKYPLVVEAEKLLKDARAKSDKQKKELTDKITKAKELVSQGKLDEGIILTDEVLKLDSKNTEAIALGTKWKGEKDKVQTNLKNLQSLIKQNKLPEAEKELSEAQKLHPKYPPVAEAEKILKDAKAKADKEKEKQKKEIADKITKAKELVSQGKLDEGITLTDEVLKLDSKNTEATTLATKWKGEKQTITKQVESIKKLITLKRIVDAEKELSLARKPHPKYGPIIETEKLLNEAKKKVAEEQKTEDIARSITTAKELLKQNKLDEAKKAAEELIKKDPSNAEAKNLLKQINEAKEKDTKIKTLINEAANLEKVKNLKKALEKYKEANALIPKPDLQKKIAELENTEKKILSLINEGSVSEKQGDIPQALIKYKSAHEISPDEALAKRIADLEAKQKDQQQKTQYATQLRAQGEALQKQNKIPEAIAKYKEYMTYAPNDTAMSKYISDLEKKASEEQQKTQYAMQIRAQGEALQKQNRIPEAIAKYKEYLKYMPNDQAMIKYINDLERKLADDQKKTQYAMQVRTQGEALQKQNKIPEAIAKYKEYMTYAPNDTAMSKYISDLEKKASEEQQKTQYAMQIRAQGEALQKQNRMPEAIAKYKEYLRYVPGDTAMVNFIRDLESRIALSVDTGRAYTSRPIERPSREQAGSAWSGNWKSNPGRDGEVISFAISASGNRISGSFNVAIPYKTSSGAQKTEIFNGTIEGIVSDYRATGTFREAGSQKHSGTFEFIMSTDRSMFNCNVRSVDVNEISTGTYTVNRLR
jgi:tetratricopeptide (TPR) repeat protein